MISVKEKLYWSPVAVDVISVMFLKLILKKKFYSRLKQYVKGKSKSKEV